MRCIETYPDIHYGSEKPEVDGSTPSLTTADSPSYRGSLGFRDAQSANAGVELSERLDEHPVGLMVDLPLEVTPADPRDICRRFEAALEQCCEGDFTFAADHDVYWRAILEKLARLK